MQGLTLFTLKINPNELFEEVKFDSRLELFEFKERAMLVSDCHTEMIRGLTAEEVSNPFRRASIPLYRLVFFHRYAFLLPDGWAAEAIRKQERDVRQNFFIRI
jgi:hypothetical protein